MKRDPNEIKGKFELEPLEPRVMLSADALGAMAVLGKVAHQTAKHPTDNLAVTAWEATTTLTAASNVQETSHGLAYDPANQISSIFEGVTGEALSQPASAATPQDQSKSPSQSPVANASEDGSTATPEREAVPTKVQLTSSRTQATTTAQQPATASQSAKTPSVGSTLSATSVGANQGTMTQQLTQTLTAANGPPASQHTGTQTLTNTSTTLKPTGNAASSSSATPSLTPGSAPSDLFQDITTELTGIQNGTITGSPTVNFGNVSLGGVLSLTNASAKFTVTYSGGSFSGSVTLSADSASLTLGSAVTSTITGITGTYAFPAKTFSLTFGSMSFTISSFVNVTADSASLSYNPNATTNVTLTNGTTTSSKAVSLLTIGVGNASIFAGVNGPTTNSNAMGVSVTGANLALALMSGSDGTTYYGLKATAASVAPVGLPTGFTLSGTNLEVDVNGSTDGLNVVNFDSSFTAGTGLTVATGAKTSINLDFTQGMVQASGTIALDIDGFVDISGSMAFQEGTTTTVTLSDTTQVQVSVLEIGASNVSIFAGMNGPSTNANAVGVQVTGATFGLALFTPTSATDTTTYYGLSASATTIAGVGLPTGFTATGSNLSVQINGASSGTAVVNFDTSFVQGTGLAIPTGGTAVNLDFTGSLLQVTGTIDLDFDGFVDISGSMSFQEGTTATVTLSDTSTVQVSVLEIGASNVTVFAGVNGPGTNAGAMGFQVTGASFGLALFKPTAAGNTNTYYGLSASATSIGGVGLPTGVTASGGNLNVQINGASTGSAFVNFDTSFVKGTGLAVATGGTPVDLDFTGSLLAVSGSFNFTFSSYISLSGGFSFTQAAGTVTINVGASAYSGAPALNFSFGSGTTTYFSATGGLSMSFDASSITITSATLTVNSGLTIPSILQVDTLTVSLSNISIDRATGNITGAVVNGNPSDPDLTITAGTATLFPGNSTISASITPTTQGGNGLQGVFNLQTGAFNITLQQFALTVGTILTANATNVVISYNPADTDPNQQLVSIGSGTITFNQFGSGITGNVTNLVIYADGFQFASLTVSYTGSIQFGSILTLTNPSVTLTNFAVTFGGGNTTFTETGALTVTIDSGTLNLGSISTSVTGLAVTVSLDPSTFGDVTVNAATINFQISSILTLAATNVAIDPFATSGNPYLSVGSATVNLTIGSLTLGGSASNFSFNNSGGSVQFVEGTGFTVSISASAANLDLPSWLGFQIQQLTVYWPSFSTNPGNFTLTLSASITTIQGLPSGVAVSGYITNAVIDIGRLESGQFPITSIGGFGGTVQGTLFGIQVNATFLIGTVNLNAAGQIVNSDGTVTDPNTGNPVTGGSTTVTASIMYVGVSGGATIPGVGGIEIYIGFSQLGPLTVYLSAQTQILLDPTSGLAIGGFSGGVLFDYTLPAPNQPTDLRTTQISENNIDPTQWQQQLKQQTVLQYNSSGGGTNLSAAYSQPMVIEAGVTLDDAYLSSNTFKITGNIAICLDPSNPNETRIFIEGIATFGDSINFTAYLYLDINPGSATPVSIMFLFDETPIPNQPPVESFGGSLVFGFTDASGNPITPPAVQVTTTPETTSTGVSVNVATYTTPAPAAGWYISVSGFLQYTAPGLGSVSINGDVTLTVTNTEAVLDLWGTLNVSLLGNLAAAQGEFVINYGGPTTQFYGALEVQTGPALTQDLQQYGLTVNGAILFQINTTGANQTVYLPNITPTGGPPSGPMGPLNSTNSSPSPIIGAVVFDLTVFGIGSPYASLTYEVGGTPLLNIQGFLDMRLTNDPTTGLGFQMFIDIYTMTIGPPNSTLTFSGFGLLIINSQGLAAEISVNLNSGGIAADLDMSLSAGFNLVLNTTSQNVTYNVPTSAMFASDQKGDTMAAPAINIYTAAGGSTPTQTATSIIIPAGLPIGEMTVNNGVASFANVGPIGPYVSIAASGTLGFVGLASGPLTFNGDFQFQMSSSASGLVLSVVLQVTANLGAPVSADVSVFGAFQIDSQGIEAYLSVGASTGVVPTNYGPGLNLNATFQIAINTTNAPVTTIGGVTLPAQLAANDFQIEATGSLTLYLTQGTGFVISGTISSSTMTINGNTVSILQITGTMTATVDNNTVLSDTVNGTLVIMPNQGGLAGELSMPLTGGGSNPLDGSGYTFTGTFDFEINTTNQQQVVPVAGGNTVTIQAGPYSQVHANGTLNFGDASNGFNLTGDFFLSVSGLGLDIATSVSLTADLGGTVMMTLQASGALEITPAGLAAEFSLSVPSGSPFSLSGAFSFSGSFTFEVNTTGQEIKTTIGTVNPVNLDVPAGPYVQISVQNATLALGSSGNGLALTNGSFTLTISDSGMAVSASATLVLAAGGTNFFSLSASGALLITSTGIAADFQLGAGSQPGNSAFSFSLTFTLEINSTNKPVPTINNQTVNLPAGPYFEIAATGSLNLGPISINGSFTFTASSNSIQMAMNASLKFFDIYFTVSGNANIYSNGVIINFDLMLGNSTTPTVTLIPGVLSVSGTFLLDINTINNTFNITVANAGVNVFGFSLGDANLIIKESNGVFSATGELSFNFFNFIQLTIDFYFDSNYNYWFYGVAGGKLGSDDFNLHGSLTVEWASGSEIGATDPFSGVILTSNFEMHLDGGATAFGYNFGSVGADVEINGTEVEISAYVSISFYFFSVGGTVTIDLGSINPPAALPPPPALGSLNNGVLTLNIGPYASNRGVPSLADEDYSVELVPGTTNDVWILAPGVYSGDAQYGPNQPNLTGVVSGPQGAVQYNGVTSIVANTGSSNTNLIVYGTSGIPVTITAGGGTNEFVFGADPATITGSTGHDTVIGGTGNITFYAGTGHSVFVGGAAQNTIYNTSGSLTVIEGYQWTDTSQKPPVVNNIYYNNYDLNGSTLTYSNGGSNYSDVINGPATITLSAPGTGTAAFSVENFPGSRYVLTLNGNGNTSATASITNAGNIDLNADTIGINGTTIALQSIFRVTLIGTSTGDSLTVTNSADIPTVNLQGTAGNDSFTVNFLGNENYTVNVTGTASGNKLTINGTNANNTYTINGSPVSLGSEVVKYGGIQNLVLNTFNGNDTIDIDQTTATTVVNGGSGNDSYNLLADNQAVTLNLGSATNTVVIGSLVPTNPNGVLSGIDALVTVNGGNGGSDTMYLDNSGGNTAQTCTFTINSITGIFGSGGSMAYQGIGTIYLNLSNPGAGNPGNTLDIRSMTGTVTANLGNGDNTVNLSSTAGLAGAGSLSPLQGKLNLHGSGNDVFNADDSLSYNPQNVILTPNTLSFSDPLFITYTGFSAMNINLSQGADVFAVTDTFASASLTPVININGEAGNDVFDVFNTHAAMSIHGGSGNVSMYVFENTAPLFLYGDTGSAAFYIFAQASGQNYVLDAQLTIAGGTAGNNSLAIFGTPLNDTFVLDGTQSFSGMGLKIGFSNIQDWSLVGLGGNNTFYVEAVFIATTIIADGGSASLPTLTVPPGLPVGLPPVLPLGTPGNNTMYLGWQGANYIPGSLAGFDAPLTITSQGGTATAYVDDSTEMTSETYTLTPTTFISSSMGPNGVINYDSTIDNLNIYTGQANNIITVNGDGAGVQTTIVGGRDNDAFTVNGIPLETPLVVIGGAYTLGGNTLTVNGSGNGNNYVVTGSTIDGQGATITYDQIEQVTINGIGGNSTFTVNGDSVPTYINGGNAGDTFIVNSSSAPLFLVGGTGNDSFTINGNSDTLIASSAGGNDTFRVNGNDGSATLNGGAGTDSFTVDGNSGSLLLNGGTGPDSFLVNGNSGKLFTATGGSGNNSFIVNSNSSPATLIGGGGNNTFTVNAPLSAPLTITGAGTGDVLTVNGTPGNDYWYITNNSVSGVGAPVDYTNVTSLMVNGIAGNDTFNVLSTAPATTLNTGTGANTINVGSTAPVTGGDIDGIQGALTVVGSGHDTLNVDDSGSSTLKTGTVTLTALTGLGMGAGGITFSGLVAFNLTLGSGSETLLIVNTPSAPTTVNAGGGTDVFNVQGTTGVTNLNGGAGTDTFNLGSLAPKTGGNVDAIVGKLNIKGGSGTSTVNVDDTGVSGGLTGLLTATTLTGIGFGAGVSYTAVTALNINLGPGNGPSSIGSNKTPVALQVNQLPGNGNINLIANNTTGTLVNQLTNQLTGNNIPNLTSNNITGLLPLNPLSGNDILNLDLNNFLAGLSPIPLAVNGAFNIGSGNNTFNIQSTNSGTTTTLNTGTGSTTINVGTQAPATGGVTYGIQGPLVIVGSGHDTLNVDDSASTVNETGTLTPTQITGLGMGAGGITYSGLAALNITLGSGNDSFTVNDMTSSTVTTIDGGTGSNSAALNFSKDFSAQNLTLLNFATATLNVGGNFTGLLNDAGAISTATIGGSLTSTGTLNAGSIATMQVGADLAGLLNVTGLLGTLTVTGGTPGEIIAGDINLITVQAGYGNKVFQVIEDGVQRQIDATPVDGGSMPSDVHFSFVYDSTAKGDPSVAMNVVNGGPVVAHSFNLAFVSMASKSNFNLAYLSATGQSGISNISVDGNLLVSVTAAEAKYFGLAAKSRVGIVLPSDQITAVEVSGKLPIGMVDVAGIEAVAFAEVTTVKGKLVNILGDLGSKGHPQVLWNLLGSKPHILAATDALVIPFNETHTVKVYAQDISSNQSLLNTMTFKDSTNDNLPITAYVQIKPAMTNKAVPSIASVDMVGDGGSFVSRYSVGSLISSGPLGNVTVQSKGGIGSITAPSIFGKIAVPKGSPKAVIHITPK